MTKINDHGIEQFGTHLAGKTIAFVVSGGVAAYTAPKVIRGLRRYGCEVIVFPTKNALDFVTKQTLAWASNNEVITGLTYKSEHLSLGGTPYDGVVIYPATYNFINKISVGIADDAASSLIAGHIADTPIIFFPTMHSKMGESSILLDHIDGLERDNFNKVVCGEIDIKNDKWNVQDTRSTVSQIVRNFNPKMKGVRVLVTSGSTAAYIDQVRLITNKFGGRTGIEIANELYLNGADVTLLHSKRGVKAPSYLEPILYDTYNQYYNMAVQNSRNQNFVIASAAVTDYEPKTFTEGKISSGKDLSIELVPTKKVIDRIIEKYPKVSLISFKFDMGKTKLQMMGIAHTRIDNDLSKVVVTNDATWTEIGSKEKVFEVMGFDPRDFYKLKAVSGAIELARTLVDTFMLD